jgi:hypothetical protein
LPWFSASVIARPTPGRALPASLTAVYFLLSLLPDALEKLGVAPRLSPLAAKAQVTEKKPIKKGCSCSLAFLGVP